MEDAQEKKLKFSKTDAVDGENVTLTIDSAVQEKTYNEMKGEAGSSAAINPKSGETLALVSSPAYDPNIIARGTSKAQREAWSNDPKTDDESIYNYQFQVLCLSLLQQQLVLKRKRLIQKKS